MNIKEMNIIEDIQEDDFEPIVDTVLSSRRVTGRWSAATKEFKKLQVIRAWRKAGKPKDPDSIRNILQGIELPDDLIDQALQSHEVRTTKAGTGSIPKGATFKHRGYTAAPALTQYMWDGTQWAGKTSSGEWRKTDPASTDPVLKASDDEMYERYVAAAGRNKITKPDGTPMRVPAPTEPVKTSLAGGLDPDMEMQALAKILMDAGMVEVEAIPQRFGDPDIKTLKVPNEALRDQLNLNSKGIVFEEQKTNMENEMRVDEMCGEECGPEMEMPKTNYNLSVTKDEGNTHKTMTVTSDQPDELIRVLQLSGMDTGHSEPDGDEIAGVDMDHDEPSSVSSMKDLISKVSHPPVGHDEAVEEVIEVEQDHRSDPKHFGLKDLVIGQTKKQPRQRRVAAHHGDNPYKDAGQLEEDYTAAYDEYKNEK